MRLPKLNPVAIVLGIVVLVGLLSRYNRLAGPGAVAFSGRLRGRALPLGRYRATYTASDASGNRSAPRRLFFRIVLR